MKSSLIHTPEGVRDIYNIECAKKLNLEKRMKEVLKIYSYRDIQTPTFEYFDVFSREVGTTSSKDLYKFFDREGNTLVLRPDFTPSIARAAAKYFMDEDMPIRLCYTGNTFINNSSYQGRLKETTQLGAELLGDDSVEADGETIALVIDLLLKAGLEEFQISIGQIDFFKALLSEAGIDEETEKSLRELISNKNQFGLEEFVAEHGLSKELQGIFTRLPELYGSLEVLTTARELTKNQRALAAIDRLEELYHILEIYELEKYISFDLGMVSKYNYYTGIIFRGYTFGTGDAIVKGGRYDNLLSHFGKSSPSIGFAVEIDQLMNSLSRQKIELPYDSNYTLILYKKEHQKLAIALANHFRKTGVNVELILQRTDKELEDYKGYATRNGIGGILYFESPDQVQVINVADQTTQLANIAEFM